jgi:hypothetical protein
MRGCHQTHGDVEMRAPPVPLLRMQGGCLYCGCREGASTADAGRVPLLRMQGGCLNCGCREGASTANARRAPLLRMQGGCLYWDIALPETEGYLPCRRQRDACPAGDRGMLALPETEGCLPCRRQGCRRSRGDVGMLARRASLYSLIVAASVADEGHTRRPPPRHIR